MKLPSYTFYVGNVVCVPVRSFFHCRSFFTLVAASVSQSVVPTAIKSSYFSSDEIGLLLLLSLAVALSWYPLKCGH